MCVISFYLQIGSKDNCEAKLDTEDEEMEQDGKENVVPKQNGKDNVAPPKKRRRKRVPKVCVIRRNNGTLLHIFRMMKSRKLKGWVDLEKKKRNLGL